MRWIKTAARNRKYGGPYFGERKCFNVTLERVQKGFLSERKGKVILCKWIENRKGAGANSEESGARDLEAESMRSRAESTGGCVKLNILTDIRRSSASGTLIVESVYFVLNALLNWEPVERLKQRSDVVSFTCFC